MDAGQGELLSRVARALADASTDPTTLLQAAANEVAKAIDAFCGFLRVSSAGDALEGIGLGAPEGESIPPSATGLLWRPIPLAGDSLPAKTVRARTTLVTEISEDSLRTSYSNDADRDEARRFEAKGAMFVPVFVGGNVRGVLAMFRRGERAVPFTTGERTFAERLADYAALALANADLLREANERAARMQLLSDLTREAAAAVHDYQGLLDAIARRIGGAMADSCVVRVQNAEGEQLSGVAAYHRDPAIEEFLRATLTTSASSASPLTDRVLATNRSVLIPQVNLDALGTNDLARTILERLRPTTIASVPLRQGGGSVGVILVARGAGGAPFTQADLSVLEDLAAQVTIAIANARSLQKSESAAARLRVLTAASAEFAEARSAAQIVELMAQRLVATLGGMCLVRLLVDNGETLDPHATIAHPDPAVVALVRAVIATEPGQPEGIVERILRGESIAISGTPAEAAAFTHPRYRPLVEQLGARSVIGIPLRAGATPIGAVMLVRPGEPWSQDDILMTTEMVRHAALAVRNNRLLSTVQHELGERQRAEHALHVSEERLRHVQKMDAIGRLAGGVAHDFNNLLSVVLSSCEFLEEAIAPDSPLREDVGEIRQAGLRAANLTRQLLAFSRQQPIERRVLDLNEQLASMEGLLRRLLGEDYTVIVRLSPGLRAIRADATHIQQVLMNLAVNARDAMPNGGTLTLETENVELDGEFAGHRFEVPPGRYVMVTVSDTGEGMTKEVQERIFEPFFTTKAIGKGTGLGLAMVFGIVKQNGGTIWVYSEPGIGTTFRVYFPCLAEAEAPPPASTTRIPRVKGTETILVAEDEDAVRNTIVSILERGGYRVIETRNGGEALAAYERCNGDIDLVLTDVVMPVMGGPELVQRLQARSIAPKILYMSGYTADKVDPETLAPALLAKPFTPRSVLERVRQMLDMA